MDETVLKVVTLNVAELLPSSEADASSWTKQRAMAHVAHQIAHDADVLCVQEWPSPTMVFDDKIWLTSPMVRSHCGYCAVMLRKTTFECFTPMESSAPCATVLACLHAGQAIIISSMHNTPFSEMEAQRLRNLVHLVDSVVVPSKCPAIIAGDFNMRKKEDASATKLLGLQDAFQVAKSPKDKKFTWNTYINAYHAGARKYNARYDRIYFTSPKGIQTKLCAKPSTFDLVAHKKITDGLSGKEFFLSDHFGLTQTFTISDTSRKAPMVATASSKLSKSTDPTSNTTTRDQSSGKRSPGESSSLTATSNPHHHQVVKKSKPEEEEEVDPKRTKEGSEEEILIIDDDDEEEKEEDNISDVD